MGVGARNGFCAGLTLCGGGGGRENGVLVPSRDCVGGACGGSGRAGRAVLGGDAGGPSDLENVRGGGGGKVPERGGRGGACDGRATLDLPSPSKTSRSDFPALFTIIGPVSCIRDEYDVATRLARSSPTLIESGRLPSGNRFDANSMRSASTPHGSWFFRGGARMQFCARTVRSSSVPRAWTRARYGRTIAGP